MPALNGEALKPNDALAYNSRKKLMSDDAGRLQQMAATQLPGGIAAWSVVPQTPHPPGEPAASMTTADACASAAAPLVATPLVAMMLTASSTAIARTVMTPSFESFDTSHNKYHTLFWLSRSQARSPNANASLTFQRKERPHSSSTSTLSLTVGSKRPFLNRVAVSPSAEEGHNGKLSPH
jgi:hypothetical protein